MTYPKLPSTIASRQMNLLFDAKRETRLAMLIRLLDSAPARS
jgi:hypothetical protein